MTRRILGILLLASLSGSAATAMEACNNTVESSLTLPPVVVSGLPTLYGYVGDAGCAPVVLGSSPYIAVEVNLNFEVADADLGDKFVLRPPGTCQGASNCGSLSFEVLDGNGNVINVSGAPFRGAAQEVDLPASVIDAGAVSVRIVLDGDWGTAWYPFQDAGYDISGWKASMGMATIPICPVPATAMADAGAQGGWDAEAGSPTDGGNSVVQEAGAVEAGAVEAGASDAGDGGFASDAADSGFASDAADSGFASDAADGG